MTRRPDITEAVFMAQVIALLKLHGWRYYHTHDSRRSVPGFPDIMAVKGNRLLAIELKARKGRLTPEQQEWLTDLDRVYGVESYVLRPGNDLVQITSLLTQDEVPFG